MSRRTSVGVVLSAVLAMSSISAVAAQDYEITSDPVTLVVWDGETGDAPNIMLDQLNAEFEEMYPNVTIERLTKSFEDLTATLPLAVSDPNPPDIVPVNYGWTQMGAFVEAGHLLPLDVYAEQSGWRDRVPASFIKPHTFSSDGQKFGGDTLYSFSYAGQWVGVYYNKEKLAALGLDVPTTCDEFIAAIDTALEAGELPVQAGFLEKWPATHVWEPFENAIVDKEWARDFVYGDNDASFDIPGNIEAATIVQDLAERGAFGSNFNGVSVDDAVNQFTAGNGLFFIQGTWFSKGIYDAMGDNVGMFILPRCDGGDPVATASPGYGYSITARSANPDVAAAYLDYITGERAAQILVENGSLPAITVDDPGGNPLFSDILAGWRVLSETDGMVPFQDWAAPPLLQNLSVAIQELMDGRITPQEMVDRVQTDYADFYADR
jgi:raffinose/stachyose/melibiose transport system substrate-binding protein